MLKTAPTVGCFGFKKVKKRYVSLI